MRVNVSYTTEGGARGKVRESQVEVLVGEGEDPTLVAAQMVAGRIQGQHPGAHPMVVSSRYVE